MNSDRSWSSVITADDLAFDRALDDLSDGRDPFGVFSLFKRAAKAKVDGCSIEGHRPATREDWVVIRSYRGWQQEGQRFVSRWAGIARSISYPCLPSEWDVARDELLRLGSFVERLSRLLDRPGPIPRDNSGGFSLWHRR